jgi:hypothetical protein
VFPTFSKNNTLVTFFIFGTFRRFLGVFRTYFSDSIPLANKAIAIVFHAAVKATKSSLTGQNGIKEDVKKGDMNVGNCIGCLPGVMAVLKLAGDVSGHTPENILHFNLHDGESSANPYSYRQKKSPFPLLSIQ